MFGQKVWLIFFICFTPLVNNPLQDLSKNLNLGWACLLDHDFHTIKANGIETRVIFIFENLKFKINVNFFEDLTSSFLWD
jgi:hypothetical protein